MPLILCSHDENFAWLNRTDDRNTAVKLANPKTAEYQVVRTSLLARSAQRPFGRKQEAQCSRSRFSKSRTLLSKTRA